MDCGFFKCSWNVLSKIQNLKANHNFHLGAVQHKQVGTFCQRYKIWKQITTCSEFGVVRSSLERFVKDTKSESKSQRRSGSRSTASVGTFCQRYKIWKQITTLTPQIFLQILLERFVKDTKSESKSQLIRYSLILNPSWNVLSKIQNLKERYKIWDKLYCRAKNPAFLIEPQSALGVPQTGHLQRKSPKNALGVRQTGHLQHPGGKKSDHIRQREGIAEAEGRMMRWERRGRPRPHELKGPAPKAWEG